MNLEDDPNRYYLKLARKKSTKTMLMPPVSAEKALARVRANDFAHKGGAYRPGVVEKQSQAQQVDERQCGPPGKLTNTIHVNRSGDPRIMFIFCMI
jgi:hypothetical protein